MKEFVLREDMRDAILSYLMTRPFKEVESGVMMLRSLKEVEVKDIKEDSNKLKAVK